MEKSENKKVIQFKIITIFPDFFKPMLEYGIFSRAYKKGLIGFETIDLRDFATDNYKSVDDEPYGGGSGMVFKPIPLGKAIKKAKSKKETKVVYLTPSGRVFNSDIAKELAKEEELVFICGRYEGIDQRIVDLYVDYEISIGDYVISGGELAAMVVVDAVARQVKGVVKEMDSVVKDSFYDGLLDYPHYTRPETYNGLKVPEVLLSGDHKRIELWREKMKLVETLTKRPDLLERAKLNDLQRKLLKEIKQQLRRLT
ncbi:tRNA (guanine37-N1)-methyltransferase [Thermotomaculum hydrothermale]|uniref:tRNA (guanine-N(1)-)-methyltransferase n=1 Tax=Thermotomaculum hydrothermale TaxID=981385 RepID=A0A7R6SYK5_9BACT|nr:tRNA (guanosine(37)-N1)-methyltransferase TrmD [Thermotomaculum hydrothermale]BBB31935.1 tRNA (guanine37-N1)-methyltransferase [Thermotomaculum hydrothermale]